MKTNFDLNDYRDAYDVMHCQTEDEANSFLEFLHDSGRTWEDGTSYNEKNNYSMYKHDTVYHFNRGLYGSKDYAISRRCNVLEWSDFIVDDDEDEMSEEEFHDALSELLCM